MSIRFQLPSRLTHRASTLSLAIQLACGSLIYAAPVVLSTLWSSTANAETAAGNAIAEKRVAFNIPAGPLAEALNRFAETTGLYLSGAGTLTQNKSSTGLKGEYSVAGGLQKLLSGTGVGFRFSDTNTVTLVKQDSSTAVLPQVMVSADSSGAEALPEPYAGGQVARGGKLGLLGETDIMDAPFSITSYTAQTIEDQQARSVLDVLANEPSVRAASARTNINEDFTVRGLPVPSSDMAFNGMYGLTPYFRVPVEMAERIEVLKGPSALLNGMPPGGSIGGAINLVPKRAEATPLARLTAEYLSDSIYGAHVDAGQRFGDDNAFGARFNGVLRSGDSTVDYQEEQDELATLALDYKGERLRATVDMYYQQQEIEGVVRQFTLSAGVTDLPKAPDGNINYPGGWGDLEMEDSGGVARVEYDVSNAITAYVSAGTRSSSMDALAGNPSLVNNDGDYAFGPAWQLFDTDSNSYEAGIDAVFATGSVSHQFALGATKVEQDQDIFFDFMSFSPGTGNLYKSDNSLSVSTAGIQPNKVPYNEKTLTSYAVADTLGFFDDRLKVTAGVRQQQVEAADFNFLTGAPISAAYDETEITPVVGVVVKPWQQVSLYANYIEGLSPGPKAPLGTPSAAIAPFVSKQTELGAKGDWDSIGGTIAVYEIEQPGGELSGLIFTGNEQQLRGLELTTFGEPVESVRLLGGLNWIHAELTETSDTANKGNDAVGVPELQGNIGSEWDTPFLNGFTLTARAVYTGETYVDTANTLAADAWTRIDIGARYRTAAFDKPVVLRASVENLLDENYWGVSTFGYLHVGDARTVLVSATIDL
ncbi:MAG TPA: TonB-dependent receptor [Dongiaceae bacterium]|nr:TonB-dependent receptor [Dongiaceae bacterium]